MEINEFAWLVHDLACAKGWYDDETNDSFQVKCNNLHNEVSELHEAWRKGALRDPCDKVDGMRALGLRPLSCMEEELADIVIRAFDMMVRYKIDPAEVLQIKHQYNCSRPYRHGGKKG